MKVRELMSFL
ncbi:UNVERIFIED_CONTAM: hypothetical protein GTU68_033168 [Idotea baltica]|nr:hypothetical protein [Idotea baltica]